jgi:DNA-directed RNA polymerase specialized sigma24 family protein
MEDNKLTKSLVRNAQEGNNSAFQQLYKMSIKRTFAFCYRLTGNLSNSEAITKKTYVKAWQIISQKDESISFVDWVNTLIASAVLRDGNSSPESEFDKESLFSNPIEKRILKLAPIQRIIFVLHDVEKQEIEIISDVIGKSKLETNDLLIAARRNLISFAKE